MERRPNVSWFMTMRNDDMILQEIRVLFLISLRSIKGPAIHWGEEKFGVIMETFAYFLHFNPVTLNIQGAHGGASCATQYRLVCCLQSYLTKINPWRFSFFISYLQVRHHEKFLRNNLKRLLDRDKCFKVYLCQTYTTYLKGIKFLAHT